VVGLILGGLLLLALFVVIELEVDNPLLDLGVFRSWPFVNSLLIISVQTVGMFATMFFIPVFLQGALGMGAMEAGVLMLPQALMMGIVAPISGRLFDRFGPRWVAFTGLIMASAATYLMTGLTLNVSRGQIIWWTCLRAIGVSLAMMAVTSSGISALEPRIVSSGTAFNNIAQRVSAALGLAALSAMVTGMQAQFSAARYGLIAATSPLVSGLTLPQLYQLGTQTSFEVMANAYTNAFRLTTWFTLAAAVLSLGLRAGRVQQPVDGALSAPVD
jgi:predicted MFS family arabinose efflux permease